MGDDGLDPAAAPPLCDALDDETVAVRRTAGDADSDPGGSAGDSADGQGARGSEQTSPPAR